jgi:8-oxo-dGTP diphosphatase
MPDRIRVNALIISGDRVALVEFNTPELGKHFDLPSGGLEEGESLQEGVRRECREEIGCEVRVGRLLGVAEHWPESPDDHYEGQHVLDFIFECELEAGQEINLPEVHDEDQIGVAWRSISDLQRASIKSDAAKWLLERRGAGGDDLYRRNIWTQM